MRTAGGHEQASHAHPPAFTPRQDTQIHGDKAVHISPDKHFRTAKHGQYSEDQQKQCHAEQQGIYTCSRASILESKIKKKKNTKKTPLDSVAPQPRR